MKITIIGWQPRSHATVEIVSSWPDEMDNLLAVAKAAREADINILEQVLVEKEEVTPVHRCNKCNGVLDSAGVCHWCKMGKKPPPAQESD